MIIDLGKRDLITIEDFSNREIEAVFRVADQMAEGLREQSNVCRGMIMASLFFEPSTRTRLSFETAMLRLGGSVINTVDLKATSLSKGESIADMARIVGSYADIIVIRHPWEGAAKVVADHIADYSDVPVINAGDGGHEHPSQTLCDLYTLKKEKHKLEGLKVALFGDLKYGRTVHSLIYALLRFGAHVRFLQRPGMEMPDYVIRKLREEYRAQVKYEDVSQLGQGLQSFPADAIYMSPSGQGKLPLDIPETTVQIEVKQFNGIGRRAVDALYVTRRQRERLEMQAGMEESREIYPVVDKKLLADKDYKKAIVMHPLPRVDELAYELDDDPRSMYFKQAERGVPVRMALISLLLGAKEVDIPFGPPEAFASKKEYPVYKRAPGIRCANERCVSYHESERRYILPEFLIVSQDPLTLRCVYCENERKPDYVASSKWHEGTLENKRYHTVDELMRRKIKIKPENLIIFDSEQDARRQGFKLGKRTA